MTTFVFDLFGNIGTRYEQFDGSTAHPFQSLDISIWMERLSLRPFQNNRQPTPSFMQNRTPAPCVVIPPMSRWLFTRCCNDPSQCTKAGAEDFEQHLLAEFLQLRGALIRQLIGMGVTNFQVMDSCCTTVCNPTAKTATRLFELRIKSD
jgi:hypothetical protein